MPYHSFSLNLLAGGLYRTTPLWNKGADRLDACYKCYLPVRGSAEVTTVLGSYTIQPGALYFIPGFHLKSQLCEREMTVHWVHFTPESFDLHRRLNQARGVVAWPLRGLQWLVGDFSRISEVFENRGKDRNRLRLSPPIDLVCRIQAILMFLVGDLLRIHPEENQDEGPAMLRLKQAIDFMDSSFLANPPLERLAQRARMAPNSFHRLFKRVMGLTPFDYMERKRLDEARRLLGDGRLSLQEVAESSGYENPFYFSRVFRRHFGSPPSEFRRLRMP
jgi:AraC-like DNA-binding protein